MREIELLSGSLEPTYCTTSCRTIGALSMQMIKMQSLKVIALIDTLSHDLHYIFIMYMTMHTERSTYKTSR